MSWEIAETAEIDTCLALRRAVFIDDSPKNVAAGAALGLTAIHFTEASDLARRLSVLGLLGR